MTITQQGLLILMKSAVLQQPLTLPEGFSLAEAGRLIRAHGISPLIYEGGVLCGLDQNSPQMRALFQQYCTALQKSERQLRDFRRVCTLFEENGIDYMPLKGSNMKPRYPRPELRPMGDADILIRLDQYDTIRQLLPGLGFTEKLESDHELIWQSRGLYLELHKRLIPSYNRDYYAYFGDGWQLAKCKTGTRHAMTEADEFIYIFTHFAKHFRDGGIGCRHVLDFWVLLRTCPTLDMGYIRRELEKLRLREFFENILRLIRFWFEEGEGSEKTDLIAEYIWNSGSFGVHEAHLLSQSVKAENYSGFGRGGRLLYLWHLLFPGMISMRKLYPVLERWPVLVPLCWVHRLVYRTFFRRGTVKRHTRNLRTLSREKLDSRRNMLNHVGLDYRLENEM